MSDPDPSNPLDLRFLPSWLKEENNPPNYASFSGDDERAPRDRDDRFGKRPDRRGPRRDGAPAPRPADRGNAPRRPGFSPGGSGQQSGPRGGSGNQGSGPRPERGPREERPARPAEMPPQVEIQFLPEEIALEKVTEQIVASVAAYPLFAVARMFLQRPERHHLRFTPLEGQTLYKINGTSIISTDRQRLESMAFKETKDQWFKVEVTEAEEIKGNFTSVARSTLTGELFGPTSHHTFQSAMHREYEERFSRRMSFAEFRSKVETTSDPAVVEQWKQQTRRTEKYVTLQADPEQTFASAPEAEAYFRTTILPGLIVATPTETLTGEQSRELRDHRLMQTVRIAWDREMKFPLGMVNSLRNSLQKLNLHIFKYKKRILLISTIKPFFLDPRANLSSSIRSILAAIGEFPGLTRKALNERLTSGLTEVSADEVQAQKNVFAGDLYWLVRQGHVIEFADGTLDLPLGPKAVENAVPTETKSDDTSSEETPAEAPATDSPAVEETDTEYQVQQPHQ